MNLTSLISRALDADPEELHFRFAQQAFTIRNKQSKVFPNGGHLHSLGLNESSLNDWIQERQAKWFLTAKRRDELRDYYDEHDLERSLLIRRAEIVVDGKMPIFSREPVDFSGDDRWRKDFFLDITAPQDFYGEIGYLDVEQVGDSKHVWEPNRFGWVYWLGQAYVITQDKKYAKAFAGLTLDWFEKNPYTIGINYCSSLEIAFRSYSLVWALDLFSDIFAANVVLLDRILEIIWRGCLHIENNLSLYFAPNTHLTGEAFALFVCGAALPEFAEAQRWRSLGESILVAESAKQFHEDGTHRELSSCYHLYSTDFYLQAELISRHTGFELDSKISKTAEKLSQRLVELVPHSLVLPQFNDCDGGRLTGFALEALDAAPTLFAASELFDLDLPTADRTRGGYCSWMTQSQVDQSVETEPNAKSTLPDLVDPDSGIIAYRTQEKDYLLARCGPFGYLDCGHSHDAPTSFLYYSSGQSVIVDSGTGSYTQDLKTRDNFRSAAGKNILLLNGQGPSTPEGWFTWERKTLARLQSASQFEGGFYLKTRHNGYSTALGFKVQIAREIVVLDEGLLVVVDHWEAEEPVHASLHLTLAPRLNVTHVGRLLFEEDGSEFHYLISPHLAIADDSESKTADNTEDEIDAVDDIPEQEWAQDIRFRPKVRNVPYSPDYGIIGETKALISDFGSARTGFATTILSRLGPARNTNDSERFRIGLDNSERELFVGRSGRIYLSGKKTGTKTAEPIVFAR